MIPDAEKVISKYLRDATDARVVSKTPEDTDQPWVRLTLLDDPAVGGDRHEHLIEAFVQLDCYAGKAGGLPEANLLSRTIRAALAEISNYEHDEATVTGATSRRRRMPDDSFPTARERFIVTARVWMHS